MLQKTLRFFLSIVLFTLFFNNSFSQSWNALGTGAAGNVNSVIVLNGALIAAGSFTTAGGVTVNNIASWNGTSWTALGTGTDGVVYALTIFNGQLIAAGGFTTAGGVTCNKIARWTGSAWAALGLGANDTIYALSNYSGSLRAGGKFTTIGGVNCNRIARWDGTNWFNMGNGFNGPVYSMVVNTDLYVGGNFTNGGGFVGNRIARYNGNYFQLGNGIDNGQVNALTVFGGNIIAGGTFTLIGGVTVNSIARWSGTNWNGVGNGIVGSVKSFGLDGANLDVGGNFTNAGGTNANSIASWNGTSYSAFGNGITGGAATVNAITVWSNVLIAGGSFSAAGLDNNEVAVNNIAAYGSLPAAPTLLSPANTSTGQSITPLLDWSDVTATTSYGVQVSTSPTMTPLIVNQANIATSQYQVGAALNNNTVYFWRANAVNGLGAGPYSGVFFFTTNVVGIINTQEIPLTFNLYNNYPNPFNPTTKIRFDLPAGNNGAKINLVVFDVAGREVSTLLNTNYTAGKWEVDFNASNFPSGAYFYKLTAGDFTAVNKMILIK